ncbi:MAG: hypothetical protein HYX69_11075 [Planctomycetia bacterium]|nr:hypothetical protein [Planctomycetia bacterium]
MSTIEVMSIHSSWSACLGGGNSETKDVFAALRGGFDPGTTAGIDGTATALPQCGHFPWRPAMVSATRNSFPQ